MPSLKITFNGKTEVRVNLLHSMSLGVHYSWVGDPDEVEALHLLHVGGVEGSEQVRWETPEVSVGDVITIQICDETAENTTMTRAPHVRMPR